MQNSKPTLFSQRSAFSQKLFQFRLGNTDNEIRSVRIAVAIQQAFVGILSESDLFAVIGPTDALDLFFHAAEGSEPLRASTERNVGIADDGKIVYEEIKLITCAESKVLFLARDLTGLRFIDRAAGRFDPTADSAQKQQIKERIKNEKQGF